MTTETTEVRTNKGNSGKNPFAIHGFQHYYLYGVRRCKHKADFVEAPMACVVLHVDKDGIASRGISICSDKDQWDRRKGFRNALSRCRRAIMTETESTRISDIGTREAYRFTSQYYMYNYMSEHNIVPVDIEHHILKCMRTRFYGTPKDT